MRQEKLLSGIALLTREAEDESLLTREAEDGVMCKLHELAGVFLWYSI
jgi:hypothetical protein